MSMGATGSLLLSSSQASSCPIWTFLQSPPSLLLLLLQDPFLQHLRAVHCRDLEPPSLRTFWSFPLLPGWKQNCSPQLARSCRTWPCILHLQGSHHSPHVSPQSSPTPAPSEALAVPLSGALSPPSWLRHPADPALTEQPRGPPLAVSAQQCPCIHRTLPRPHHSLLSEETPPSPTLLLACASPREHCLSVTSGSLVR